MAAHLRTRPGRITQIIRCQLLGIFAGILLPQLFQQLLLQNHPRPDMVLHDGFRRKGKEIALVGDDIEPILFPLLRLKLGHFPAHCPAAFAILAACSTSAIFPISDVLPEK